MLVAQHTLVKKALMGSSRYVGLRPWSASCFLGQDLNRVSMVHLRMLSRTAGACHTCAPKSKRAAQERGQQMRRSWQASSPASSTCQDLCYCWRRS